MDNLNLTCCGITCLHTQQSQVHLISEIGISSIAGTLAHSSRAEPWYFVLCHCAVKISEDLGPKFGTFPAQAHVKVRHSQYTSTKLSSPVLSSFSDLNYHLASRDFPGLHFFFVSLFLSLHLKISFFPLSVRSE